jgi:hypothetical protein
VRPRPVCFPARVLNFQTSLFAPWPHVFTALRLALFRASSVLRIYSAQILLVACPFR